MNYKRLKLTFEVEKCVHQPGSATKVGSLMWLRQPEAGQGRGKQRYVACFNQTFVTHGKQKLAAA